MKNKKENKNPYIPDERQMQIRGKSAVVALVFVLICLGVATVYRIVTTDNIGWEFWVILASLAVMLIAGRIFGDIEAPKDIFGKPLPLGNSKEDKKARKKDYFLRSVYFALGMTVMEIILITTGEFELTDMDVAEAIFPNLGRGATIAVTVVIAFVSMFIISYVCDYIIGEKFKVKRYNALMAKLDAEEDEDED